MFYPSTSSRPRGAERLTGPERHVSNETPVVYVISRAVAVELFKPALLDMAESMVRAPEAWSVYLKRHGLAAPRDTPHYLSVQDLRHLAPELAAEKVMIFRCGAGEGARGTRFALARAANWPDDYFLPDDAAPGTPDIFLSAAPNRQLFVYTLVKPVERTLVNLAFATGALAELLLLDERGPFEAPATGATTYSFDFKPRMDDSAVFKHANGQVDVDAMLVAQRGRREHVFVIEAKYNSASESINSDARRLAKHKLLFPVLGLQQRVPAGMPIVPVSLRAVVYDRHVDFHVIECEQYAGSADGPISVDRIVPAAEARHLRLPIVLPLSTSIK